MVHSSTHLTESEVLQTLIKGTPAVPFSNSAISAQIPSCRLPHSCTIPHSEEDTALWLKIKSVPPRTISAKRKQVATNCLSGQIIQKVPQTEVRSYFWIKLGVWALSLLLTVCIQKPEQVSSPELISSHIKRVLTLVLPLYFSQTIEMTCESTFKLQASIYYKFSFLRANFLFLPLEERCFTAGPLNWSNQKVPINSSGFGARAVHQQGQEFNQFTEDLQACLRECPSV